tara:strand:+ start:39 stop:1958 length:1920 start_codon:yes stop_codon:yes gene_type:complete
MTSQIIPTNPTSGSASTSSVRENFRIADEEITKLQRTNIDAQELTGGPISYSVTYPLAESVFEYVDGMRIAARVNQTNSASSVLSLSVNNSTSILLKSLDGSALVAGDLVAGQYYEFILNSPGGGATPHFACVNINKNFKEVSVEGITVTSPALGGTAGDETIQAEFKTTNANASYLKIQDERWKDGADWTSASKLLQFGIDSTDQAYIASNTEGSGVAGIEIGTHSAGAREKFFVGDADGGVGLYYNNAKKLETTDDGVVITSGNTDVDVQPQLLLRSNEPRSDDNHLGGITFQGSFADGIPRAYGFLRVESPVSTTGEEEGRFRFFVRKTQNLFHNVLNLASNGIDVDGGVFADYIDLNGSNSSDTRTPVTGDVFCKRIRLDDPTDDLTDNFTIYTENNTSGSGVEAGSMVLSSQDNPDDKIIFRMGNWNGTVNNPVDILTATANYIRVPAEKRLQFGTESSGYLEIFEAENGDGYLKQVGAGSLVIQGNDGYIYGDTNSLAYWNESKIILKYQSNNRFETESFGTTTTGTSKAKNFQSDTTQITDDTTWSAFARNGGSNALYVQQGDTASFIASFRKGSLNAGAGTEVLGVRSGGIVVGGTIQGVHVANDGTAGVTATVSNPTQFTVRNGLITAIS